MRFRKLCFRFHIAALLLLATNFIICVTFDYRIIDPIVFPARITWVLSGIILFFLYLKPLKKRTLYFGFFIFIPLVALVIPPFSMLISPVFFPKNMVVRQHNIVFYDSSVPLSHSCCKHEVWRREAVIFEKNIANPNGKIELEHSKFATEGDTLYVNCNFKSYADAEIIYDTVMKFKM